MIIFPIDLNFELGEYDAFRLHSVGAVYAYILDLYSCRSGGGVSDATFLYHDEEELPQWSGTPVVRSFPDLTICLLSISSLCY